jgi:hypothetical protein
MDENPSTLDPDKYDVIIVGSGLPETIIAG